MSADQIFTIVFTIIQYIATSFIDTNIPVTTFDTVTESNLIELWILSLYRIT